MPPVTATAPLTPGDHARLAAKGSEPVETSDGHLRIRPVLGGEVAARSWPWRQIERRLWRIAHASLNTRLALARITSSFSPASSGRTSALTTGISF